MPINAIDPKKLAQIKWFVEHCPETVDPLMCGVVILICEHEETIARINKENERLRAVVDAVQRSERSGFLTDYVFLYRTRSDLAGTPRFAEYWGGIADALETYNDGQ